jgi:hypothetical protein
MLVKISLYLAVESILHSCLMLDDTRCLCSLQLLSHMEGISDSQWQKAWNRPLFIFTLEMESFQTYLCHSGILFHSMFSTSCCWNLCSSQSCSSRLQLSNGCHCSSGCMYSSGPQPENHSEPWPLKSKDQMTPTDCLFFLCLVKKIRDIILWWNPNFISCVLASFALEKPKAINL